MIIKKKHLLNQVGGVGGLENLRKVIHFQTFQSQFSRKKKIYLYISTSLNSYFSLVQSIYHVTTIVIYIFGYILINKIESHLVVDFFQVSLGIETKVIF